MIRLDPTLFHKVNALSLNPGDTVLILTRSTWYDGYDHRVFIAVVEHHNRQPYYVVQSPFDAAHKIHFTPQEVHGVVMLDSLRSYEPPPAQRTTPSEEIAF